MNLQEIFAHKHNMYLEVSADVNISHFLEQNGGGGEEVTLDHKMDL